MQLQDWLGMHGGVLEGFTAQPLQNASRRYYPAKAYKEQEQDWCPLELPILQLMQLCSLQLRHLRVELAARGMGLSSLLTKPGQSSSSSSAIGNSSEGVDASAAVLPQLQKLRLRGCQLTVQLASQLLSATALTELQWEYAIAAVQLHSDDWTQELTDRQALSTLWQQLQLHQLSKLLDLQLRVVVRKPADIAPLSSLQHLQRVKFQLEYGADEDAYEWDWDPHEYPRALLPYGQTG